MGARLTNVGYKRTIRFNETHGSYLRSYLRKYAFGPRYRCSVWPDPTLTDRRRICRLVAHLLRGYMHRVARDAEALAGCAHLLEIALAVVKEEHVVIVRRLLQQQPCSLGKSHRHDLAAASTSP